MPFKVCRAVSATGCGTMVNPAPTVWMGPGCCRSHRPVANTLLALTGTRLRKLPLALDEARA